MPTLLASAITAVAGYVDAVGYAHMGNLYLSFMSGNSTRLGLALGEAKLDAIASAAAVIGLFVLGAVLGTLLGDALPTRRITATLAAEAALFALGAGLLAGGIGFSALLPLAGAMGMQNTIHQTVHGADIGKSFVTGALFSLGQSLALALRGRASAAACAFYALSWALFVTGAALGVTLLGRLGLETAVAAAGGALLLLALLAAWKRL
ncbi:YoaK family protein [Ancylobacter lacus]|uniref:YoaK family protein n=1 Tax=Ancylobacter lacus TaxID=2579970 RepID=UPI001BCADE54|nr:YoaK family protein [Ancylobacter lacus]MBS7540443.1 DUF1275 domain-containing protein [Ancylobacter lacus]